MKLKDVRVDPQIQKIIPPLNTREKELLREGIAKDGIREPLVVWKEKGILLDGHHRRRICMDLKKEPPLVMLSFKNKTDARLWVMRNQAGRRNLSKEDRNALIRAYYNAIKKSTRFKKGKSGNPSGKKKQEDTLGTPAPETAAEETGEKFGMSASGIKKVVAESKAKKKKTQDKTPKGIIKWVLLIPKGLRHRFNRERTHRNEKPGITLDRVLTQLDALRKQVEELERANTILHEQKTRSKPCGKGTLSGVEKLHALQRGGTL